MKKYQEVLNKLKHRSERFGQDLYDTAKEEIDTLQELIDKVSLIQKALLEGIETIEFGVIDSPYYISLKKDWRKDNSIGLHVYVKEQGMAFDYSLDSYGTLWKLKDDKWKVEYNEIK